MSKLSKLEAFQQMGTMLIDQTKQIELLEKWREAFRLKMAKLLPDVLPEILENLGINAGELAKKLGRAPSSISMCLKDNGATLPILTGIMALLAGKKPTMIKTTKKPRKGK